MKLNLVTQLSLRYGMVHSSVRSKVSEGSTIRVAGNLHKSVTKSQRMWFTTFMTCEAVNMIDIRLWWANTACYHLQHASASHNKATVHMRTDLWLCQNSQSRQSPNSQSVSQGVNRHRNQQNAKETGKANKYSIRDRTGPFICWYGKWQLQDTDWRVHNTTLLKSMKSCTHVDL